MDKVLKLGTGEMFVFSIWKALESLLLNIFTLYPPNQTGYEDNHLKKKDNKDQCFSYATLTSYVALVVALQF